MITFGIFISYLIGYLIENNPYQKYSELIILLFTLPIFLGFLQIFLIVFFFKIETPTYLLKTKHSKQALEMMSRLYFAHDFDESQEMNDSLSFDRQSMTFKEVILSLSNNQALRIGCIFAGLQQLSGINFLILTSSNVYPSSKFTVILGAINCFSGTFGLIFLRKHYKKNLFIGAVGMCICYVLIIISRFVIKESSSSVFIGLTFTFIICFEFSVGPIMWIYCADILSEKGMAMTSSSNWLCATIIVVGFGYYGNKYNLYDDKKIFISFCSCSFFFCALVRST
jgi:hypothetical protein